MKKDRHLIRLLELAIVVLCFTGCAKDTGAPQAEKTNAQAEASVTETAEGSEKKAGGESEEAAEQEQEKRREIFIDFPFYGDHEGDKLVLAAPREGQDGYELIQYDKDGQILQQIACGSLTEPLTFSFDGLVSRMDLEIFSEGSDTGLLLIRRDQLFSMTPIAIPRYAEARNSAILTLAEDEDLCEKDIYLINEDRNRIEKARSFRLQKDTAMLTIWDELEHKSLFEGSVRLDENGDPLNKKYFDWLLWCDLDYLWGYQGDVIYTWVGEKPDLQEDGGEIKLDSFEAVQNNFFGNAGHTQEYESREAFLSDLGFENKEPMYQYFDRYGNLQLELYADEDREEMCGVTYFTHRFSEDLEKMTVVRNAFSLCSVIEAEWAGSDPFLLKSVYGTSAEDDSYVVDYEESVTYTDTGAPDLFLGRGRLSDREEEEDMLRINFVYREDGTLFCREYSHHDLVFGSTLQSLNSYYDEHGRVLFERGYITHGNVEYYYIYDDKDGKIAEKPSYILYIDYNLNYAIPNMIKCQ